MNKIFWSVFFALLLSDSGEIKRRSHPLAFFLCFTAVLP